MPEPAAPLTPAPPFLAAGQALLQAFQSFLPAEATAAHELAASSERLLHLQQDFAKQVAALWGAAVARQQGAVYNPVAVPDKADRRFAAAEWRDQPYYDFIKQQYLLSARFITATVEALEVDASTRHRLRFFARQYVDMTSPANFAAFNPEVLKAALESGGETLRRGVENLLRDMEHGRISQSDESGFEVGRNAGQRRIRERAHPADSISPHDRARAEATAGDDPALHQQVLHP